jgi:tetratricopeptide (TPR) repeat protein
LRYVSDSSRLYTLVCKTCIDTGNIKKAEVFCHKAIEVDSRNPNAYSLLGVISGIKGLYQESISYFEKAISIDPLYLGAYIDLGVTHARMHNFSEAKKAWEKGLKIYPESSVLQNNLKRLKQE